MHIHIGYERADSWPIERIDAPVKRAQGTHPKAVLRSDAANGSVTVDTDTRIYGIPLVAWEYRLGNRSAIDWLLDQHKERRFRDATVAAQFDTYQLADYKEKLIEAIAQVVSVAMQTLAITKDMAAVER